MLDLSFNDIDNECCKHIKNIIDLHCHTLETLRLENNMITQNGLQILCAALQKCEKLTLKIISLCVCVCVCVCVYIYNRISIENKIKQK